MLGYNRVTKATAKAKCCLPVLGAKQFRALSRSECVDDSFLKVAIALDIIQGYIPGGMALFTIPVYQEAIDNNPSYITNDPAYLPLRMDIITFNGRWNINNDITRFYSTVDISVIINGVFIGSANNVLVNTSSDYASAAASIINSSGHDYTAIAFVSQLYISQPVKSNTLRSGVNNSGAYKNTYPVYIEAQGIYPAGMCDYQMSASIIEYEQNMTDFRWLGLSVNGVYSDFQQPVMWQANYPYGHPLYDFGLQKQIDLMLNAGNVLYTTQLTPDPLGNVLQLDLTIQATFNTVDFVRYECAALGGIIDFPFDPINCGTGYFTILFQNDGNSTPLLSLGKYLLSEPPRKCTYGMSVLTDNDSDAINSIDINGVRYAFSSELPLNNPSVIQSELEGLTHALGIAWDVTYNDSFDPAMFTIRQTNYSFNTPDAVSYVINGIEDVRPFEKLSCIVFNESNYTVMQSQATQCMEESSVEEALAVIEQHCCGCSGEPTTPLYPNLINVLEGGNENSIITDENNNPIET